MLEKIGNIGRDMPIVELEEYVKQKQAEKETSSSFDQVLHLLIEGCQIQLTRLRVRAWILIWIRSVFTKFVMEFDPRIQLRYCYLQVFGKICE